MATTINPEMFRKPKVTVEEDGAAVIARQQIKAGHLVHIKLVRVTETARRNCETIGPKGEYLARVLDLNAAKKTVRVRVLATINDSYWNGREVYSNTPHALNEYDYPKSTISLIHPDAAAYPSINKDFLTASALHDFYDKLRVAMKERAKQVFSKLTRLTLEKRGLAAGGGTYAQLVKRLSTQWRNANRDTLDEATRIYYKKDTFRRIRDSKHNTVSAGEGFAERLAKAINAPAEERGRKLGLVRRDWGDYDWGRNAVDKAAFRAGMGHYASGCNHFAHDTVDVRVDRYGGTKTFCRHCFDTANEAWMRNGMARFVEWEGVLYDRDRITFHEWPDGTLRPTAPPPVINGYHSSRQYFTKPMPNPDGTKANQMPYIGVELEFVSAQNALRSNERCAIAMKEAVTAALPWVDTNNPYCLFERDGSVDFEMVTGYGPIATHREAMLAMFSGNPYARDLRSHDGGRCGIHVHLDKPKSLLHAVKLVKFWNDVANRSLIEAVARRYGAGFAQNCPGKGDIKAVVKDAMYNLRKRERYEGKEDYRKHITNTAITRLNDAGQSADRGSRYVLCNFQNSKTVELRGFRGTLRVSTIIACIEFALMSWYFSRDSEPHKLGTDEFLKYISMPAWRHETRYLRQYLKTKGFDVWMPRARVVPELVGPTNDVEV